MTDHCNNGNCQHNPQPQFQQAGSPQHLGSLGYNYTQQLMAAAPMLSDPLASAISVAISPVYAMLLQQRQEILNLTAVQAQTREELQQLRKQPAPEQSGKIVALNAVLKTEETSDYEKYVQQFLLPGMKEDAAAVALAKKAKAKLRARQKAAKKKMGGRTYNCLDLFESPDGFHFTADDKQTLTDLGHVLGVAPRHTWGLLDKLYNMLTGAVDPELEPVYAGFAKSCFGPHRSWIELREFVTRHANNLHASSLAATDLIGDYTPKHLPTLSRNVMMLSHMLATLLAHEKVKWSPAQASKYAWFLLCDLVGRTPAATASPLRQRARTVIQQITEEGRKQTKAGKLAQDAIRRALAVILRVAMSELGVNGTPLPLTSDKEVAAAVEFPNAEMKELF